MDLQPGDIFALRGKGLAGWAARNLIFPGTDRFHFGIVWRKHGNDYIILESIFPKGVSVGLLSQYNTNELEFYRVNCSEELRRRAPLGLIRHGRSLYDVFLILKLVTGFVVAQLRLWGMGKFRKVQPEDIPYVRDSSFVCTEAVQAAYLSVGVSIVPKGIVPMPNSYMKAVMRKKMSKITE